MNARTWPHTAAECLLRSLRRHPGRLPAAAVLATLCSVLIAPAASCAQERPAQELAVTQEQPAAREPDVHFVPTPTAVVEQMLAVARVDKHDTLYDLGSGDGRIVIAAAKHRGATGVGIDIDPQRIAESRYNADTAGVAGRVEFRQADLFETDLRPATVVTLYLLPRLNIQLRPKLFEELRPGTRVVSHDFDMGEWAPDSTFSVDGRPVHYWVMPAGVSGPWNVTTSLDGADGRYELRIDQDFQTLAGTATSGGRSMRIEGRVSGEQLTFALIDGAGDAAARVEFDGRVDGSGMSGSVRRGNTRRGTWRATR